jgi:hypothetical protein
MSNIPAKYQPSKNTGYAYLASIGLTEWYIIGWGEADAKTVRFGTAGRNVLYLPLYYADGVQTPVNYPFLLDDNDNIRFFEPDTGNYLAMTTGCGFWHTLKASSFETPSRHLLKYNNDNQSKRIKFEKFNLSL